MEEKDEWVYFKEIDWDCPKNNRFNVDTRDFHCGYFWEDSQHRDIHKLNKYPDRFFHTRSELETLLVRLYEKSGGPGKWRMLSLLGGDYRTDNWRLKYLRIWRIGNRFLVCNSDGQSIPKKMLNLSIDEVALFHQNYKT
jgi:hypothetical protein